MSLCWVTGGYFDTVKMASLSVPRFPYLTLVVWLGAFRHLPMVTLHSPNLDSPLLPGCTLFLIQASDESFQKPGLVVRCYSLSCPERLNKRSEANMKPAWATWQDALFKSDQRILEVVPSLHRGSRGWTGFPGLMRLCFLTEPSRQQGHHLLREDVLHS